MQAPRSTPVIDVIRGQPHVPVPPHAQAGHHHARRRLLALQPRAAQAGRQAGRQAVSEAHTGGSPDDV